MISEVEHLPNTSKNISRKSYIMARRRYRAERSTMLSRYGLDSTAKTEEIIASLHFMCKDQPNNAEVKAMRDLETEKYMDHMAEREVGS